MPATWLADSRNTIANASTSRPRNQRGAGSFTNVGKEFPRADGDIPRLLGVLLENGVRIAA